MTQVRSSFNIITNRNSSFSGQSNTPRTSHTAAFAAHNFNHVIVTSLKGITFQKFEVFFVETVNSFSSDFYFTFNQRLNSTSHTASPIIPRLRHMLSANESPRLVSR